MRSVPEMQKYISEPEEILSRAVGKEQEKVQVVLRHHKPEQCYFLSTWDTRHCLKNLDLCVAIEGQSTA